MSRRKVRRGIKWTFILLAFGLPILALMLLGQVFGWLSIVVGFCLLCSLFFLIKLIIKKRRYASLMEKYGDEDLVADIEDGYYWQGQTAEQLRDALGDPDDIDEKVLKTKIKSVWKYNHQGSNRYGLRINLDDAVVTGWDRKD